METRAIAKTVRIAPRKARLVIDLIRGKPVNEAMGILSLTPNQAAKPVRKLLFSAISNAEEGADQEVVSTSSVGLPSQKNFKYMGSLSLKSVFIDGNKWSNIDTDHGSDTVGVVDRLVNASQSTNVSLAVAPAVFEGIDFSGNIALTASQGDFNTSNVDLYASIGIHCADTVDNCRNGASNSD